MNYLQLRIYIYFILALIHILTLIEQKYLTGFGFCPTVLPMQEAKRLRHGDVREDGFVFVSYHPSRKDGERWVSPERFELMRLGRITRYHAKNLLRVKHKKPKKERFVSDLFPIRRRRKPVRRIIQKEIDKLPFAPILPLDMTTPSELTIIPNYSKYAIAFDGTVFRVHPASRGRTAGMTHRVTPVIHPRGHQWCVQLTGDDGKRRRLPIKNLVNSVFGDAETIS